MTCQIHELSLHLPTLLILIQPHKIKGYFIQVCHRTSSSSNLFNSHVRKRSRWHRSDISTETVSRRLTFYLLKTVVYFEKIRRSEASFFCLGIQLAPLKRKWFKNRFVPCLLLLKHFYTFTTTLQFLDVAVTVSLLIILYSKNEIVAVFVILWQEKVQATAVVSCKATVKLDVLDKSFRLGYGNVALQV